MQSILSICVGYYAITAGEDYPDVNSNLLKQQRGIFSDKCQMNVKADGNSR